MIKVALILLQIVKWIINRIDEKRVGDAAVARERFDQLEAEYEDVWKATSAKRLALERFDREQRELHNNTIPHDGD